MFARAILLTSSCLMIALLGYYFPNAILAALEAVGNLKSYLISSLGITGHLALLLQLSSAAISLLFACVVFINGIALKGIFTQFFRVKHIFFATLLPLLAHGVEWILGLYWPNLLTPVYELAQLLLDQIGQAWKVRLTLFGGRDLIETFILSVMLLGIWQGLIIILRRLFGRRKKVTVSSPPTSPKPSGWKGKAMKLFGKTSKKTKIDLKKTSSGRTNGLTAFEKTVITFLIAIAVPVVMANLIKGFVSPDSPILFWILATAGCAYTLIFGFVKQGELENSVGGIVNQFTNWIIAEGISWWVPKPFGQVLQTRSVEKRTTKMTAGDEGPITEVSTNDGGQVEISEVVEWRIKDVRNAARYPGNLLDQRVKDLIERNTRWFALYWDSDDTEENNFSLVRQKTPFSRYIVGDTDGITDRNGEPIEYDPTDPTTTNAKAEELGVELIMAEVKDINQPQAVRDARNAAAAEAGQAVQEEKDMQSLRKRVLELMWGTSVDSEIREKVDEGQIPLMTSEEAQQAARAARGDLEEIRVTGSGGDFTKGAAVTRKPRKGKVA